MFPYRGSRWVGGLNEKLESMGGWVGGLLTIAAAEWRGVCPSCTNMPSRVLLVLARAGFSWRVVARDCFVWVGGWVGVMNGL